MRIFFFALSIVIITAIFPIVILVFVLFSSAIALTIFSLRLAASFFHHKQLETTTDNAGVFISVHVPIHNEPPLLVKNTLRALSALDYKNYEVLVIDNNTTNPAIWKPVEAYCATLGPRFRFFHVENLKGYKAGALNYLAEKVDPAARYVAVVDADYEVQPNFLSEAVRYFTKKVALVQFPQSYSNAGEGNRGILLDYEYFFASFMNMGNYLHGISSTGTLSIVSIEALHALQEWDEDVLTEDIELGVRMNLLGYKGVYVDQVIGQGVMPYDVSSLRKQRSRWSFGNAQTLRKHIVALFFARGLTLGQRIALILQLTAWFDFDILLGTIALGTVPLWLVTQQTVFESTISVAASTVLLCHFLQCISFLITLRKRGYTYRDAWYAYITRLGFLWISGTTWIRAFSEQHEAFVHTNKFLSEKHTKRRRRMRLELAKSAAVFCAGIALMQIHLLLGAMLLAVGMSALSILFVRRQTVHTRRYSARLFQRIEQSFTHTQA
jgi:cellulose synthase/poly-beta-1,6-N-acetylglucosamine synthase-like glycosyltransferase